MLTKGDRVMIDGGQQGIVERNVGGDDYIVQMGGRRVAVPGNRMRLVAHAPVKAAAPTPEVTPTDTSPPAP